jgi:hypothetical protein
MWTVSKIYDVFEREKFVHVNFLLVFELSGIGVHVGIYWGHRIEKVATEGKVKATFTGQLIEGQYE